MKVMASKKLGFAIVGTGAIAGHHAACINGLEDCELVAVCSSSPERAEAAEQKFGVPAYSDVEEMLQRTDIDVVCICTHSGAHLAPTLAAAQAGKHVICEKPLEINLERADQMIRACRVMGVKLACIFQNRFSSDYLKLKKAVQEGRLGKLLLGNAYIKWFRDENYYRSSPWKGTIKGDGGAALINQGIHTIDLLLDIMGDVESVRAKVKTVRHDIEGEDLGIAMLSFRNGALGAIQASTALYPGYPERLEVFGEKGSVILEGGHITAWNIAGEEKDGPVEEKKKDTGASDPMAISTERHQQQFRDMIEAIRADREPVVNGEEGRRSLALIRAIYDSSAKDGAVVLD